MSAGPDGDSGAGEFETLLYGAADGVATITLNRPESLNTIVPPMPEEVEAAVELINRAVPFERLEETVAEAARQLVAIPASQLAAMKLVVNHAYENMGLASTQALGPILDGLMRNTPDAKRFIDLAEREGVPAAVRERDAPFADYSQAPPQDRPDPNNVIEP
jgi:enoyl-CoA hydratase